MNGANPGATCRRSREPERSGPGWEPNSYAAVVDESARCAPGNCSVEAAIQDIRGAGGQPCRRACTLRSKPASAPGWGGVHEEPTRDEANCEIECRRSGRYLCRVDRGLDRSPVRDHPLPMWAHEVTIIRTKYVELREKPYLQAVRSNAEGADLANDRITHQHRASRGVASPVVG